MDMKIYINSCGVVHEDLKRRLIEVENKHIKRKLEPVVEPHRRMNENNVV
jgi:hypothetical protein